jgi:hypothetical protein
MGFKKEVVEKLTKIEVQLGINNQILQVHEQRSNDLHLRVKPLEDSHVFFMKLSKAIISIVAVSAGILGIIKYLVMK